MGVAGDASEAMRWNSPHLSESTVVLSCDQACIDQRRPARCGTVNWKYIGFKAMVARKDVFNDVDIIVDVIHWDCVCDGRNPG